MSTKVKAALGIAVAALEFALQLGGYQNVCLAWVLGSISFFFLGYAGYDYLQDRRKGDLVAKLHDVLAHELREGENLHKRNDKALAEAWATRVNALIETAYGQGESRLFLNSDNYVFFGGTQIDNWVEGRRRRLVELMQRMPELKIRDGLRESDLKRQ